MEKIEFPQLDGNSCCPNISEILSFVVTQIDDRQQSKSSELPLTGVSTGFPELDRLTLGLQPGELIVVGGRPDSGRYALALKFVEHIAGKLRQPVVFHSLTNTAEEVALRLLSNISGVSSYRMRTGQLHDNDWQKLSVGMSILHDAPLAIESIQRNNFEHCIEQTRSYVKNVGRPLGLIVIDDFHAFSFVGSQCSLSEARFNALSVLHDLAVDLNTPLLILSQLDAQVDRRHNIKPSLADLPRSGFIEAVADTILLLHRDYDHEFDVNPSLGPRQCFIKIHEAKSHFDFSGECRIPLADGLMPISLHWGTQSA